MAASEGFWYKHGPNMVEYLILAGILAVFVIAWQFKDNFAKLQSDTNLLLMNQQKVTSKAERNGEAISKLQVDSVTRVELGLMVGRIEHSIDRMEDKLDGGRHRINPTLRRNK